MVISTFPSVLSVPFRQHALNLAVVLTPACRQRVKQGFVVIIDIPAARIRRVQSDSTAASSVDGFGDVVIAQ